MTEFIIWVVSIVGYSSMVGLTFRWIADHSDMYPDAIAVLALFWPVSLPASGSYHLAGAVSKRTPRVEKRRQKELAEAKHRKELARIDAEALAIHEHSLNLS